MRSDDLAHRLGPYVHRFLPRSLRVRLALAAAVCTLAGVGATFGLVHTVASRTFTGLAEETATQHLSAFGAFVEIQREEIGVIGASVADGWMRHAGPRGSADDTRASAWLDGTMRAEGCSALVVVDTSGGTLAATGAPVAVDALREVAGRRSPKAVTGLIWADSVQVVASRPLKDASGRTVGFLALTRSLDPAVRTRFLPLDEGVAMTFAAPSATPRVIGVNAAGFSTVRFAKTGNGESRTLADLPGLWSPSAGTVELVVRDERMSSAMNLAGQAAVGTAILVSVFGVGFGLALAEAVRRPLVRTQTHLREEGARALEGLPCEKAGVRPETTTEFIELAREVDALLEALSSRQNDLVSATEQARRAEGSLRSALDDSPEAKLLVEDGRIVLANTAAETMLGVPAAQFVGMSAQELIDGASAFQENGERFTMETAQAMGDRPTIVRFSQPGRPERWAELTTIPHLPDPSRVLVSARDITEQRRLEALREEIFSLVSHDLRAPLTVVQGYLDILERPLQPAARERALESARHNARKMAGLLEDLLDATAPEDLLTPKSVQPTSLYAIAKDVVSSMQAATHEHSILLVCDADAVVLGEERRLRQAAVNLVSNAIKYAPEETTVTVRVGSREGLALLAVEDEGPGVPAEARETVFTRYGRLASTERKPGLGLGLYIVRIIAETHGGSARVEDAPGGGARFVLELPLADESVGAV